MDDFMKLMNEIKMNEEKNEIKMNEEKNKDKKEEKNKDKKEEKKEENKMNETELYQKYKSTYESAFIDFGQHALFLWCAFYAMYYFKNSYMTIFTIPFTSFMLLRTFIVFHDCQHESYTPSPVVNNILSHITGVFILTSSNWILDHNTHHLTNGNKENKYNYKFNELLYWNLNQYKKFDKKHKSIFCFFHTPIVFFTFFPFLYFFIIQRFIYILKKFTYKDKIKWDMYTIFFNHIVNNIGIYVIYYMTYKYNIFIQFLLSSYISCILDFLLFFNQHTYNPCYVVGNEEWTQKNSGIIGSSFIQLPWFLKFFYMGIEYHHIHHMNAKIPGYNIQKYHEEVIKKSDMFDSIIKLSLWDCYQNLWLVLYDEDAKKYIRLDELEEKDKIK